MIELKNLLTNSLFYPACELDGGVIKYCNEHYEELGVSSYVYADYGIKKNRLIRHLDRFTGYHLAETYHLTSADFGFDFSQISTACNENDKAMIALHSQKPFAIYAVFANDRDSHGPVYFTLLYLCLEGVTVYENLYLKKGIVPSAMAIIQPGTGFGGNWTDFRNPSAPLALTVMKGETMPEFFFYGGWGAFSYDDFKWPGYQQIDVIDNYFPDKEGRVIVWKRDYQSKLI